MSMAEPSRKSEQVDGLIKEVFGIDRKDNIQKNLCVFCKKQADKFRDAASAKEFTISGICQECQDGVFGV